MKEQSDIVVLTESRYDPSVNLMPEDVEDDDVTIKSIEVHSLKDLPYTSTNSIESTPEHKWPNKSKTVGCAEKSRFYTCESDKPFVNEDITKFEDKYFNSLFKDVPNEFTGDDLNFLTNKKKWMNRASSTRKSKSEKINTNEPMADLKLKTSISGKVVSSNAENASNKVCSSVSYVHPDIKRNRPVKEHFIESEKVLHSKISDQVSNKDAPIFSRKSNTERTKATSPMVNPQLKTSISDKIISLKAEIANYENVSNDIKLNRAAKERRKEIEKETRVETIDQVSKASSIVTIHSKNVDMKKNIVTRSTLTDGITFKNEATNTDIKFVLLNMNETPPSLELRRKIREEFNKLISNTGKKASQKDFNKFSKKIYDKYGIYLKATQVDIHDSKTSLKLKLNNIEEIESNALKELEREEQILQEILNRIKSKTKVRVNEDKHNREDSIGEMKPESKDDSLSVKNSTLLNTVDYIKEGVNHLFSGESLKFSLGIEKNDKGIINKPGNVKVGEKNEPTRGMEIKKGNKRGNIKLQDIKILDSCQSEDSVIKTSVEKFNKRGIQIWDSDDYPRDLVHSAINKFNEELKQPENGAKKSKDTNTTYNEKQTQSKEEERKPKFVIKEIEIVDQQISTKKPPELTSQKELRAFRSPLHPDKTTTDGDVTSKSKIITEEHAVTSGDSEVEMTTLNDMFTADKEKLIEKRKAVQSEKDKKSVVLPESEFSKQSHLKIKSTRIKEKGRPDKFELHSVYKEVSTTSQISEISKLPSKQCSSIQKDDNVFVNNQEESKVDSPIDLKQIKAESEEFKRKIIICKKCLQALSGFIPSKIVEETEISADCQLCGLKEKQKEAWNGKGQVCDTPGLSHNKCYDRKTWSEKCPCGRANEDQKLVLFHDASYNKVDESKVNDDVRKFVINDDDGKFVTTFNPCKSDKPAVSTVIAELDVTTVPTVSTKHSFAEMIAKSLAGLLGIEQTKQTIASESPCRSEKTFYSCESSDSFDAPCSIYEKQGRPDCLEVMVDSFEVGVESADVSELNNKRGGGIRHR
ncbi:uncharacterized protein LOC113227531 [Hyposmocoma kahamanoa]|uniref:uncharacterized protein LOC113227531 n=1 Tax=Hyposmocoma kahamanoa TaxID=1477025 RepID=UPI000E6D9171|nr:uncharacterized protein LOC113227531 [Hyposmocoma kahamanoa]